MSCTVEAGESSRVAAAVDRAQLPLQELFQQVDERLHKLFDRYTAIKSAASSARSQPQSTTHPQLNLPVAETVIAPLSPRQQTSTEKIDFSFPQPTSNSLRSHRTWDRQTFCSKCDKEEQVVVEKCWSDISDNPDEKFVDKVESLRNNKSSIKSGNKSSPRPETPSTILIRQLEGLSLEDRNIEDLKSKVDAALSGQRGAAKQVDQILEKEIQKENVELELIKKQEGAHFDFVQDGDHLVGIRPGHAQQRIFKPNQEPTLQEHFARANQEFVLRSLNRQAQIQAKRPFRANLENLILPNGGIIKRHFSRRMPRILPRNTISLKTAREETARRLRHVEPVKKSYEVILAERRCRRQRLVLYSKLVQDRNHHLYGEPDVLAPRR